MRCPARSTKGWVMRHAETVTFGGSGLDRAAEIRDATMVHLYDDEEMAFVRDISGRAPFVASGRIPTGPTAWVVWPFRMLPWDDARIDAELRRDLDQAGD